MAEKKLGFGLMRLPLLNPDDETSVDIEQLKKMVDMFIERGFNYFDTAYPYHGETSELAIKEALIKRYPRDKYLLADKMPVLRIKSADEYEKYFNEQLEKCGVEYFDYYLLHNLGRDRYTDVIKNDGFKFLRKIKEKGLVKYIGFSFHDTSDILDEILTEHPEVDFVQLQINYLDWESDTIESRKNYEVATKHGKKITVMEPVKGGTLANLPEKAAEKFKEFYKDEKVMPSYPSLAIRYVASLDNVMRVLSGMSNLEQLDDNTSYMVDFKPLSDGEIKLAEEITKIINSTIKVPCTNCKYCTEVCPMNINIPAYFSLLNMYATVNKKSDMYYNRYKMNRGLASDCIKCGQCETICPQYIQIRDFLEEFKELYEK